MKTPAKISPLAIDMAIAEYLKWTSIHTRGDTLYGTSPKSSTGGRYKVPRYSESYDAIHEVIATLTHAQARQMVYELVAVLDAAHNNGTDTALYDTMDDNIDAIVPVLRATPGQLALALCRALNLELAVL